MSLRHLSARLKGDTRGATIVEFALIALPACVLLVGGLDVSYQGYVRAVMQGALNDTARRAAVEGPEFDAEGDTIEEQVENAIRAQVGTVARGATIQVTQTSYREFSSVGLPEKLVRDVEGNGVFDEDDGDCWEDIDRDGEFDEEGGVEGRGGASDVVFYTATVGMPRLFPLHRLTSVPERMAMTLDTAVRNQPYTTQATAPTVCATPA